jgi:hypothetical protein
MSSASVSTCLAAAVWLILGAVAPLSSQSRPSDFAGQWETASDDGTTVEVLELAAAGTDVSGSLTVYERGYFSGRTSVVREIVIQGTPGPGGLAIQAWDAAADPGEGTPGTALRRGEYLVLRIGDAESSYAPPGVELVRSAEGSAEAEALARAVAGRIYGAGGQASGRGGFVGGRIRIAFCADGRMEYDASDLTSTPDAGGGSVDLGSARTRRGGWEIVLRGGEPVVRAHWDGTGSSYSLSEYFRIRPAGVGAVFDGRERAHRGWC